MRILVLGSGAREHALCWRLSLEPGVEVICAPGNPGIARTTDVISVDPVQPQAVMALADRLQADLTVVGPEAPLASGIADYFQQHGRLLFGPTRAAAQLETSKAFAKDFMARHGVPTGRYRVCQSADEALNVVRSGELGEATVVKADGLAAGKGVVVAPDRRSAENAIRAAMLDRAFGEAGTRVVLEECLHGPEVSFFVIADGTAFRALLTAQDHKRVFDNDLGPNTGGMGAFCPSPLVDASLQAQIERGVVMPVLEGMQAEGHPFRGFLYCGLMLTATGPRVIEFNVRFGDPEAQVVLPLVVEPLAPLLLAAAQGRLGELLPNSLSTPRRDQECAVGVVLAAEGYPGVVKTGSALRGLDHLAHEYPDVLAFFAGVTSSNDHLVTAGGRVMTLVARAGSYQAAIDRVYDAIDRVGFEGVQFRRDIGRKAVTT